jgi:hypothetical protein
MCTITPGTMSRAKTFADPTGMADYIAPEEKIKGLDRMVLRGR